MVLGPVADVHFHFDKQVYGEDCPPWGARLKMIRVVVPHKAARASFQEALANSLISEASAVAFDNKCDEVLHVAKILARDNRSSRHDVRERHPENVPHLDRSETADRPATYVVRYRSHARRVQQVVFAATVVRKLLRATKHIQAMLPGTGGRGFDAPGQCAVAQWGANSCMMSA
jgi:hypothetical protein